MVIKNDKVSICFSVVFVMVSLVLSVLASVFVLKESGAAPASMLCNVFVYSAFWPSMLLKIKEQDLWFSAGPFVWNAAIYGLMGFVIGVLVRKLQKQ